VVLRYKLFRLLDRFVRKQGSQLESIHDGLAFEMVVRDHVGAPRSLRDRSHAVRPRFQLLYSVEAARVIWSGFYR
jgi:hypothetical protein